MTHCRFEDRLSGQARVLSGLVRRIAAHSVADLPTAFTEIERAQQAGNWICLLLDYELGEWLEPSLQRDHHPDSVPSGFAAPRLTALVFDRMQIELPWSSEVLDDSSATITAVAPLLEHRTYVKRIEEIKRWIAAGEVYQINTTFAFEVLIQGSAQSLYRQLANRHPSAHAAFIQEQGRSILSFSPELFLQRLGTTLVTRPMKGTAPRSADPLEDQRLGQALQHSEKDRAENLMIVDLLRNDLVRIALPGSVIAAPIFSLEAYPSVWTMTSTIQATIEQKTSLEQILRALFPCGSITGAPKIAAMQRIQQTEAQARGLYCGSIGWLAPNGDFSLNVAIRTLLLDEGGKGTYQVGGGIVHDSIAEQEWQECHWKARIVIDKS